MNNASLKRACSLLAVTIIGVISPQTLASAPDVPRVDTGSFRDLLTLLADDKGNYIAVNSFEYTTTNQSLGEFFFYGDNTHLFRQLSQGRGSSTSEKTLSVSFWSPRAHKSRNGALRLKDGQYTVHCGDRSKTFKPLKTAARDAMLAKVEFFERKWQRRAYLLARDDEGIYYYVDRARTPPDNFDFHLYTGHRGNMKRVPLVNIVSDTEGDIFASKRGRLRLVHNAGRDRAEKSLVWIKGRSRKPLTNVPVGMNAQLIYRDLGVYDGLRLGNPCDDL